MLRVGTGFDVHRFGKGDSIILGGVMIPWNQGIIAHSDGDVLIHALCDALLGAAALGDIGQMFPDTDAKYQNINSRELLKQVALLLIEKAYSINNVDIIVIAQAPPIMPHAQAIKENIVADLKLPFNCINIKATTTEKLGYIGRSEGIAVQATALIEQNK